MFIKKLSLKNFRNYKQLDIDLTKNINIIIGNNAQGKTSLVEGIYTLSTTKSHRTTKDTQMIRFNQDFAKLSTEVLQENEIIQLNLTITKKGKNAKYNNIPISKLSSYVGKLKTVFFAPEDLELIKGAPAIRRKFLNMELGQIDPLYLHHLSNYGKILKQRNEHLKNYTETKQNELMLEVLTEQLAEPLLYILKKRIWFLQKLEQHAKEVHNFITKGKESISFEYQNSMKIEQLNKENLLAKFAEQYPTDKRIHITTIGAHRDDFLIYLTNMNAHAFASQGQQRTAILSIKLAEIDLIHEETRTYPILLLDDVLSELDASRQIKLLASTKGKTQTFITTTSVSGISKEIIDASDIFVIENWEIGDYNE